MSLKLHDHQDLAQLWSTFNAQRLLGVGIAALAFAPLVTNANGLWTGPGRWTFVLAIVLLSTSILSAHASLYAHRVLAMQHALYANLRRNKEAALKLMEQQTGTAEWRQHLDELNKEDEKLAEEAVPHLQRLEKRLALQYGAALFGALAMLVALIQTPIA